MLQKYPTFFGVINASANAEKERKKERQKERERERERCVCDIVVVVVVVVGCMYVPGGMEVTLYDVIALPPS